MHLLYYDEVKYHPENQPAYWLGGICVEDINVTEIENQTNKIVQEIFGNCELNRNTEIHAIELIRGKGYFKGKNPEERMKWLQKILKVIAQKNIHKIYVKIIPENNQNKINNGNHEIVFKKLAEETDKLFKKLNTIGMLIGDYDETHIKISVNNMFQLKQTKTKYIIDTPQFVRSHHSRMIQLADVYIYCTQFMQQENKSQWRKNVAEIIQNSRVNK